jgi:hypothetical protein
MFHVMLVHAADFGNRLKTRDKLCAQMKEQHLQLPLRELVTTNYTICLFS